MSGIESGREERVLCVMQDQTAMQSSTERSERRQDHAVLIIKSRGAASDNAATRELYLNLIYRCIWPSEHFVVLSIHDACTSIHLIVCVFIRQVGPISTEESEAVCSVDNIVPCVCLKTGDGALVRL